MKCRFWRPATAAADVRQRLRVCLVPLVGPEAESDDVVVRSFRAKFWATNYLDLNQA